MAKLIFSNIIGCFVFDGKHKIADSIIFENAQQYRNKSFYEKKLMQKHNPEFPNDADIFDILLHFKSSKYFKHFHEKNLDITKNSIRESVASDELITQTISCIEEINKTTNLLVKRLREWYSLYNPEISYIVEEHEKFVSLVINKPKMQILKEWNISKNDSMGAEIKEKDVSTILLLASQIKNLYQLKLNYENYLSEILKETCPNFMEVGGASIAAKLLSHAGSLKKIAEMPASTIQVLGAEKALFRHMRNKKRNLAPKYGFLHEHPLIQKSKKELHGKIARTLADKLCIAVKVDYFKGKFIGDKLKKYLIEKFNMPY
ncbi:hypothetical protein HYX01_02075 [Candidatus Woesearchaeota archaeon]|nr:hypothetical protein [Candidatus Woesearchaeota archaeon]